MTDERRMKKAAQAIQAMLELDGIKATVKEVVAKIEGENLGDLAKLTKDIANDMRSREASTPLATNRRQAIGDFITRHWSLLKDNDHVKSVLLNGYCMGRYSKEKREEMVKDLLDGVEEPIEISNTESEEKETLDHRQYTF